jgi:thioesterase domain-containing protein
LQSQQKEHNPIWSCNRAGNKPPLFFVHPWIGGAEVYYLFSQYLNKNQPFYAFEPYNLFSKKAFLTSMKSLAAHYVQQIMEIVPNGSFCLGGWSSGGIIAYEMAQQLMEKTKQAPNLYLIDTSLEDPWYKTAEPDIITEIKSVLEKEGHYEKLPENYRRRLEEVALSDMKMGRDYLAKPYHGNVVLFKANILMPGKTSMGAKNGLEKFVEHLHVEYFNADHLSIVSDQQNIKRIADYICIHN